MPLAQLSVTLMTRTFPFDAAPRYYSKFTAQPPRLAKTGYKMNWLCQRKQ